VAMSAVMEATVLVSMSERNATTWVPAKVWLAGALYAIWAVTVVSGVAEEVAVKEALSPVV